MLPPTATGAEIELRMCDISRTLCFFFFCCRLKLWRSILRSIYARPERQHQSRSNCVISRSKTFHPIASFHHCQTHPRHKIKVTLDLFKCIIASKFNFSAIVIKIRHYPRLKTLTFRLYYKKFLLSLLWWSLLDKLCFRISEATTLHDWWSNWNG